MKFEHPDKERLELLSNPIIKNELYDSYNRSLYYVSLVMLKLGLLRGKKAIVKKAIVNLILGSFAKVVSAAKLEKENLDAMYAAETINYTDAEQHVSSLIHAMYGYFRMDVVIEDSARLELSEINQYIENCQLSTYEYTKSRISEKLNINLNHLELLPRFPNLWLAFYFSEILYLLLNGDFEATVAHGTIRLAPCKERESSFRRSWFAEISESSSDIADLLALNSWEDFIRRPRITLENSKEIVAMCMDKVFSLRPDMLSEELQKSKDLITLKEITLFSACIECASYTNNHIPESFFRKRTNIRDETINNLITLLKDSGKGNSITSRVNFISYEDRFFKRGPQKYKFGLKKLARDMFIESTTDLKDPMGRIGESFEVDYVLNYLKGLDSFGYQAFGEFTPRGGSKTKDYDIDLILKDKSQNLFFFIQVKYWLANTPAYLDEKIKFFNNKEKFQDAVVRQLVKLKENMDERDIRDELDARGLGDAKKENSYFILLHNIPYLNFYEFAGVIFYEWNLFRNVLQNGRVFMQEYEKGVKKSTNHITTPGKMPLHKPRELIDAYFAREDAYGHSISTNWHFHKNSWNSFKLNGINFICRAF